MARFAAFAVLLAAAMLMAGRLTHAGPSTTAEAVFWRAVLPGPAVPDAVLQLLRQGVPASVGKKKDDDDKQFSGYSFGYDDGPATTRGPASQGVPASGGARDDDDDNDDDKKFSGYSFKGYDDGPATTRGPASQGVPASGGARDDDNDDDKKFSGYSFKGYDDGPTTTRDGGMATPTPTAPTTAVFFQEEAVRVGERLPIHFRAAAPASLGLLPRGVADSIPFTTAALPAVLALLGVPPGSSRAAAMAETLRTCERPAPAGDTEARFCATSLEALVERAGAALGTRDVRAVTSTVPRAGLPPQLYAVRAVRRVVGGGASFVACHDERYPYIVYFCHGTGPARAYLVEMEGARGGGAVTVAFVCHTDTSRWNPEHVSFKVLGTKPGGAPVCHLMPYGHIIWTKNVYPSPP